MEITEQIEKLEQLRDRGTLSDAEFTAAKQKLLNEQSRHHISASAAGTIHGVEEKTWCTLMHLSQLLYLSGVGIVVPIAMWILGNDQSVLVRRHGHRMMNWIISSLIYALIGLLLCFVIVGIPALFILGILSIAFPIVAAVKSNAGELWAYPLTLKFFSED